MDRPYRGRGAATANPAPLIGRDAEMRRLTGALAAVTPGRLHVLVLDGPRRSGRTRLLTEFAAMARQRGVTVVPGAEWTGAQPTSAEPNAAGPNAAGPNAAGPNATELAATDRAGPDAGPLLFTCDRPVPAGAPAWAVPARLAVSAPVLVVVAGPADVFQSGHVDRVRLGPLTGPEVGRLLAHLLGAPPGADVRDLARVAVGRPGAVHDLAAGLRAEGLVRVVAGRATLTSVRLPEPTRSWLAGELAAMTTGARHLVQAATTLRSPFRLAHLTGLLRVNPVRVLPAIDEVMESGLLVADDELLRFSHELVRSVVAASLPRAVAAALRDERRRPELERTGRERTGREQTGRQQTGRQQTGRERPGAVPHEPHPMVPHPLVPHPLASRAKPPEPGPRVVDWSLLSAREREIADLAGRALTNRQIATVVGRSPHTVNYHLRQIFQKLGLTSRVELASLLCQPGSAAPELPAGPPSSS
jgi:DNA-binding CsgD family transcriptional regulator